MKNIRVREAKKYSHKYIIIHLNFGFENECVSKRGKISEIKNNQTL
jgi:hypothetical protein